MFQKGTYAHAHICGYENVCADAGACACICRSGILPVTIGICGTASVLFQTGIHLHVPDFSVFHGGGAQDPLAAEPRFFQHPAGGGVVRTPLSKDAAHSFFSVALFRFFSICLRCASFTSSGTAGSFMNRSQGSAGQPPQCFCPFSRTQQAYTGQASGPA